MRAVVLAGGKGTRLLPYTALIPKPLVPLGDKFAILEVVLMQLKSAGFDHVTLAVSHLAHLITAYCGDGTKWGLRLDYSIEETPLSTMGPLTLIPDLPPDFLVMNGDVLCDLDFGSFLREHTRRGSEVSVAAFRRSVPIDFGVIQYDASSGQLVSFSEKPTLELDVSMGVYCLNRRTVDGFPRGQPYGFDRLMLDTIEARRQAWIYRFSGFWLDIGRPEDYQLANEQFESLSARLGIDRWSQ
jgi:NDP-sugar pyrophosphorylase family protein